MPQYYCSILSNFRWGIFYGDRLLATVSSYTEATEILQHLKIRFATHSSTINRALQTTVIVNLKIPRGANTIVVGLGELEATP
jgi:hypothetical protein